MLRAVRDNYADTLSTLPALLEQENAASIHFYIGNLTNLRKDLFPSLQEAYQQWHAEGNLAALKSMALTGKSHWERICGQVLDIAKTTPDNLNAELSQLIENNRL
jgi:hypothetical protein